MILSRFIGALLALCLAAGTGAGETRPEGTQGTRVTGWKDAPRIFASKPGKDAPNAWERRRWIDKVATRLRGGHGLGPDDDIDALMRLSDEAVVRHFMADPRFGDTVLDFNLYFLGFKPDRLKVDGAYVRAAFDFANAVTAAQALIRGGDYLALFDLAGRYYMAPLRQHAEEKPAAEDATASAAHLRARAMGEVRQAFYAVIARGAGPERPNGHEFCDLALDFVGREKEIRTRFERAFDDAEIFALTRGQVLSLPFQDLARTVRGHCVGQDENEVDVAMLTTAFRNAMARIDRAFAEILKFEPQRYSPRSVAEFRPFDLSAFPAGGQWLAFGYEQGMALGNSSTNLNRKRAAYVLKRYFCDDVVAAPPVITPHPSGAASAAASGTCASCHDRLDPMAGFFRNLGAWFFDFSRSDEIVFDDLAAADRRRYVENWRARAGSGRTWNVGYIRSTSAGPSAYGESLADLSRIIRTAPEAKRCLMRRLVEYLVFEKQTVDDGYLDHLTRSFEAEAAAAESATAMKNAIVRVVLSSAFRQRDPDPTQCYDRAPGTGDEAALPCRIAAILRKNCTGCHDSTAKGEGQLDLTRLVAIPGGRGTSFPHLDDIAEQRKAPDTFARMLDRLTTTDPRRRMPKDRTMQSDEREELLRWVQQELTRASPVAP